MQPPRGEPTCPSPSCIGRGGSWAKEEARRCWATTMTRGWMHPGLPTPAQVKHPLSNRWA